MYYSIFPNFESWSSTHQLQIFKFESLGTLNTLIILEINFGFHLKLQMTHWTYDIFSKRIKSSTSPKTPNVQSMFFNIKWPKNLISFKMPPSISIKIQILKIRSWPTSPQLFASERFWEIFLDCYWIFPQRKISTSIWFQKLKRSCPTSYWFVKKNLGDKNSIKFSTNFFRNLFFLEVMP